MHGQIKEDINCIVDGCTNKIANWQTYCYPCYLIKEAYYAVYDANHLHPLQFNDPLFRGMAIKRLRRLADWLEQQGS